MTKQKIISLLKEYNQEEVERFSSYIMKLFLEKDRKTHQAKNQWIQKVTDERVADLYKRVSNDGLVFDGVHITLQSTGISYDYIAYKNKMFLSYPESTVDVQLVYTGDDFSFSKESGKVLYSHKIGDPFNRSESNIIGGYCIIKNKRGDFLTTLNKADIDKHRKVARTDFIWKQWFAEMALKTIIKKACKQHFADVFQNIEIIDNDNYNVDNPLDMDISFKKEIDAIETMEDLVEYYHLNKGEGKEVAKYISMRKNQIEESEDEQK